jgi:hypothetical protein
MYALSLLPNTHQTDLIHRPVGGVGRQRRHGRGQVKAFKRLGV